MASAIDSALKELASVAQVLNKTSDDLTKQLTEVEAALATLKLGVKTWVTMRKCSELSDPDNEGKRYQITIVQQLGYGRNNNKWGLLFMEYCEEWFEGEPDLLEFLRDAPREIRLLAVEKLPDLLNALIKEAKQITQETAKKAAEAKQIAAGLGKNSR
jgi:hypothetical protein